MVNRAATPVRLPVFPLTGCILLPGNLLPLNIFELRYRNLVADVLAAERCFGMIQPIRPLADNRAPFDLPRASPELYRVGCAGRMEACEPQPDGRYLIVLKGVRRFRTVRELPLRRGYRVFEVDYTGFERDIEEWHSPVDASPLLGAIEEMAREGRLEVELERARELPPAALVNALAATLPFAPAEKQAMLEARGPSERAEILLTLLGMGLEPSPGGETAPPHVH
jgi:hypothetical protein